MKESTPLTLYVAYTAKPGCREAFVRQIVMEGIADTITDGENGFLVPAGDIDETERVMRQVFAHPEAYEALRQKGMRSAHELTWARNAEKTAEVYREAIEHWRKEHAQAGH